MPRILRRESRPDGLTEFTFDIDGVRRGTFVLPTIRLEGLQSTDLEVIAQMQVDLGQVPELGPGEGFS